MSSLFTGGSPSDPGYWEVIFDVIPFPVYVADFETLDIICANRAMRQRTGAAPGQKCHQAIYRRDTPCSFCRVPDLAQSGGQNENCIVFEHFNDVDDRWYHLREAAITWFDGRRAKYSIAVDITSMKVVQNQLAEAHAELALKARDLNNAVLKAEEAAKIKAEFLAVMSHEIRTPVNGILGMIQLALGLAADPQQRAYLETALDTSEVLLTVLNDTLDLSKLEAGRYVLEKSAFDLVRTVQGAVRLLESRAGEKGLGLEITIGPNVPRWLSGDATRLRQILLNLVGNAVKFTDQGRIAVVVTLEPGTSLRLRFEVSDTGIGIAADLQKYLFQPYTQADATISRRFGGTGLGLAICRKLVEMLDGAIGMDSISGKGSRFWFTLPFEASSPDQAAAPTTASAPSRPLTLLVADDVEISRAVVAAMLKRHGHTVVAVANGRDALEECGRRDFDLAFMDVHMPVMDGLAATRAVRASAGRNADLPVIALTGGGAGTEWTACRDAGMNAFLGKPYREKDLLSVLNAWGNRRSATRTD